MYRSKVWKVEPLRSRRIFGNKYVLIFGVFFIHLSHDKINDLYRWQSKQDKQHSAFESVAFCSKRWNLIKMKTNLTKCSLRFEKWWLLLLLSQHYKVQWTPIKTKKTNFSAFAAHLHSNYSKYILDHFDKVVSEVIRFCFIRNERFHFRFLLYMPALYSYAYIIFWYI